MKLYKNYKNDIYTRNNVPSHDHLNTVKERKIRINDNCQLKKLETF